MNTLIRRFSLWGALILLMLLMAGCSVSIGSPNGSSEPAPGKGDIETAVALTVQAKLDQAVAEVESTPVDGDAPPTATPVPPTATPAPPTATPVPPTATSVPPTATPIPPTATPAPPTATPVPPTATPVNTLSPSDVAGMIATPMVAVSTIQAFGAVSTVSLEVIPEESGSVWQQNGGEVRDVINVGDVPSNTAAQVFLSFDISGIPAGATIDKVEVDFSEYDTLGNPFSTLGCLRGYPHDYGTLQKNDFYSGNALGAILRWCSTSELDTIQQDDNVKDALQNSLNAMRFQLRLQFNERYSDGNNFGDVVRFGSPKLIVTYSTN